MFVNLGYEKGESYLLGSNKKCLPYQRKPYGSYNVGSFAFIASLYQTEQIFKSVPFYTQFHIQNKQRHC